MESTPLSILCVLVCLMMVMKQDVLAAAPTRAELDEAARWSAAKFGGDAPAPAARPTWGMTVLENHDVVQVDARAGEPLRIGGATYGYGLYCHAKSRVVIRLPGAAEVFSATIGVDSRAGGGSIEFIVRAGEEELFRSGVMRIESPPRAISVPLKGAKEITLEVSDGGDGITSDQANWAEPRVRLEDGSEFLLQKMSLDEKRPAVSREVPLSFVYGGKSSREFLKDWKCARETITAEQSKRHTLVFTDPAGVLEVRCDAVEWLDCPTVEWTVYLKNIGKGESPIVEQLQGIDTELAAAEKEACTLHRIAGDNCTPDSYQPLSESIAAGSAKEIVAVAGRPTQIVFPYFNLARVGEGAIVAIGWPGQWAAKISRDSTKINLRGGQELTHFVLRPSEEVRTPRIVLQFYQGDWLRGQNLWRRWMVAHNMPHSDGKPAQPLNNLCTGNFYPGLMSNAKQEIAFIQQHVDAGVKFDTWWQDAGWYPCDGVTWPKTGTWEVDLGRFPKGLREVSDFVHQHGAKSIVWFEPERVQADTWLAENHPEWIHGGKAGGLLKIGDENCRAWLIEHFDKLLAEQGIDIYRQDYNIDPLEYWRKADAEDRKGIAENLHVQGYLAFWDELLKRHPGMLIDSCASGGRRNDIETMKRAVPLLRSDWYWSPDGQQCHTYGLSLWFPYQGTGAIYPKDLYWFQSSIVAGLTFGPAGGGVTEADLKTAKSAVDIHRAMGDCFLGDFYPLTPYSLGADCWMAWQYDQPEKQGGVVQVFRRSESIYESARLPLRTIDASAEYELTDLESGKTTRMAGKELSERGLPVKFDSKPGALILKYRKVAGSQT